MKNIINIVLAAILLFFLPGCASAPMASLDKDMDAKNFTPPANKAAIFIYRDESFGGAIPIAVSINDHALGQTAPKTYFRLDVKPGPYTIASMSENISKLSLSAKAGQTYYIWQEIKMGMWGPRSLLQEVSEDKGKKGVNSCKLIASGAQDSPSIKIWR